MDVYRILNLKIQNALIKKKAIGICPLGKNGLLAKQILNQRYGIQESVVVDNELCKWNKLCKSMDELPMGDNGTVIILSVENEMIRKTLKSSLISKGYVVDDLYTPSVYPAEDEEYLRILVDLLAPKKIASSCLRRFGRTGDGGYCLVDDLNEDDIVYSFGINDDVSWDKDITKTGAHVFMYDPTIDCLPEYNERFHFERIGITGDVEDKNYLLLDSILKRNCHDNNERMILKMDVEGAEWDVLENVSTEIIRKFRQITLEMHGMLDETEKDRKLKIIRKICDTHQPIWVHGNNFSYAETLDDLCVPNALEVTFASKDHYQSCKELCNVVCDLDMPNWCELPDFVLGNWSKN